MGVLMLHTSIDPSKVMTYADLYEIRENASKIVGISWLPQLLFLNIYFLIGLISAVTIDVPILSYFSFEVCNFFKDV